MASLIKFKPLEWNEEPSLLCTWWPKRLLAWIGGRGHARTWLAHRLGTSFQIVECAGKGYALYVQGEDDFAPYDTLGQAQEAAAAVVATRVRAVLEL